MSIYVYVLVDGAISSGPIAIPARPGPAPACSDAELLTIALARHLLGRRSEAGFLAEAARDWATCSRTCPSVRVQPAGPLAMGAFEQLRCWLADLLPVDGCQQVDTSVLPVKHPSQVRGPGS